MHDATVEGHWHAIEARKRKTAKLQEVPEPDADEVDQGSACGPASPTHSSPPTVDSDEDLMPLERELATAEHELALARAARWMRMADAKLKVAKRIYEAKMRRLDTTADTGSVERLSRRLMTEFELSDERKHAACIAARVS